MGCEHNPKKGQQQHKRESKLKRCGFGDKVKYSRYKEALTVCNQSAKRDNVEMEVYICSKCGKYHLTTLNKRNKMRDNLEKLNRLLDR